MTAAAISSAEFPLNRHEVLRRLTGWAPRGTSAEEMRGYVLESAGRLGATAAELMRLPQGARLLEIGGNPYFLTMLMREQRPDLAWECTNWFEGVPDTTPQVMVHEPTGQQVEVRWTSNNLERAPLPFEPETFDCVAYCEVLEHLFEDPAGSLQNVHRVLRTGGTLVLTTPNPARYDNILRLMRRGSISDPISGYGPYGRHNREYSGAELRELLLEIGFDVVRQRTIQSTRHGRLVRLAARLGYGEYHLIVARRRPGASRRFRPAWLYRSFHQR